MRLNRAAGTEPQRRDYAIFTKDAASGRATKPRRTAPCQHHRGLAVLNWPTCITCSDEQRTAIYTFLVEEKERHRERLRASGYGLPGYGADQWFWPMRTTLIDLLSMPAPPCGPGGGMNLCEIKRTHCGRILANAPEMCNGRATSDPNYVACERTATATLQTCVVTPVEGESIEDRRERCRAEHREDRVGPGGCREIYNEAYKSCTDGERQRYVDCMGDC